MRRLTCHRQPGGDTLLPGVHLLRLTNRPPIGAAILLFGIIVAAGLCWAVAHG